LPGLQSGGPHPSFDDHDPGHRPWPGDTDIEDYRAAGQPSPCLIRLRVFTLDNRLILRRLGRLTQPTAALIEQSLRRYLS
jgi:mRNA interferase MazF